MTEKRKICTAEFKYEAVRVITEQGCGMGEAAQNLGRNANILSRSQVCQPNECEEFALVT